MDYKKVQFIAHCIHTAPKFLNNGTQEYLGLDDVNNDIGERIKLVAKVLETARDNSNTKQNDASVLKIFMMPEFFFRGKNGAYKMDDVQIIIRKLQELVKNKVQWQHWIFVFGSIVSHSIKSNQTSVDRFFKLFGINLRKDVEAYNFVLVQQGGFGNDPGAGAAAANVVLKEHLSSIDFIQKKSKSGSIVLERVEHLPPANNTKSEEQKYNFDGSSVFTLKGINFGLEVCLDHLEQRLKKSVNLPSIAIQLIPSCGMSIKDNAIVARSGGYVFNCDGLANYDTNEVGFNSKVKKVGTGMSGRTYAEFKPIGKAVIKTNGIRINEIYAMGGGEIRIYPELSLKDNNLISQSKSNLFPHNESDLNYALSDEPILLNGMKVIFDKSVAVYPVNLEEKANK